MPSPGWWKAPGRRPTITEPRPLPGLDGARIGGDDEVVLHGAVALAPGLVQGVPSSIARAIPLPRAAGAVM